MSHIHAGVWRRTKFNPFCTNCQCVRHATEFRPRDQGAMNSDRDPARIRFEFSAADLADVSRRSADRRNCPRPTLARGGKLVGPARSGAVLRTRRKLHCSGGFFPIAFGLAVFFGAPVGSWLFEIGRFRHRNCARISYENPGNCWHRALINIKSRGTTSDILGTTLRVGSQ